MEETGRTTYPNAGSGCELGEKLNDAVVELEAVLNDWNAIVQASGSPTNGGAIAHVRAMREENERLKFALQFYAAEASWDGTIELSDVITGRPTGSNAMQDAGEIARAALGTPTPRATPAPSAPEARGAEEKPEPREPYLDVGEFQRLLMSHIYVGNASAAFIDWCQSCMLRAYEDGDVDEAVGEEIEAIESAYKARKQRAQVNPTA